ncbi:reverse transcriptase [Caerostris darwini]|uniref:Reverse transcriptase n=1 Tax=Caerostris darwini TaxID=1538125 RepID=A0AAV4QRY4_9ARAC|nr:reverse transcriptase [Caerostris darwini]
MREYLLNVWAKFTLPTKLANSLDEYDSFRSTTLKSFGAIPKRKVAERIRPRTRPLLRSLKKEPLFPSQTISKANQKHRNKYSDEPTLTSKFVDTQFKVAHLKITQVKCGNVVLNGVIDTGTQISIVRENLVADTPYDGERKIKISLAFGESENIPENLQELQVPIEVPQNDSSNLSQQQSIADNLQHTTFIISFQKQNISDNRHHSQNTIHSSTIENQHQADTFLKSQAPTKLITDVQGLSQAPNVVKDLATVIAEDTISKHLTENYSMLTAREEIYDSKGKITKLMGMLSKVEYEELHNKLLINRKCPQQ